MKLSEFLTALNNRIAAAKVSGFWTDVMKEQYIYESIVKVVNWKNWKCLESKKTDSTLEDIRYYTFPTTLKTDSIFLLEIDGDEYIKVNWDEFRENVEAESEDKVFSIFEGKFYVNPQPDEAGTTNIEIWGYKKAIDLVTWKAAADDSVLDEKFDESVIKLALATCLQRARRRSEAADERAEVMTPANPRIKGSGGLLALLAASEESHGAMGYIGKAKTSRK